MSTIRGSISSTPLPMSHSKHLEAEDVSTHHVTDIAYLNVGGKRYTTHFETLILSKSSYFHRFVRLDDVTGKVLLYRRYISVDSIGAIFVNRDGDLFAHALQFMRDGKRTALPQNTDILRQLIRESEFFGMEVWKSVLQQQLEATESQESQIQNLLVSINSHVTQMVEGIYFNGFKQS
nr:Potassium channel domain containing protein [Haemonchus contortus]